MIMALAFGFDDDVFGDSRVRLDKPTELYNAKQCEHMWFLKDAADHGGDKLQCLIFQGDALFHQKQWEQAVQVYRSALKMIPKRNSAMQRMLWESIARCYMHLGNCNLAQEFAMKMVDDSQSEDQKMGSQSLLAAVYQKSSNHQGEILCLHQCIHYHPFNVQFWFRLAKAYLALSRQSDEIASLQVGLQITQCSEGNAPIVTEDDECGKRDRNDASGILEGMVEDKTSHCHGSNVETEKCTSALRMGSMRECLNEVPVGSKSQGVLDCTCFAMGCLVRCSVLLGTVQQTVTSFAKSKNEQLQNEAESLLKDLQMDSSIIQKVRQLTEDDVFKRDSKLEDTTGKGLNDADSGELSNIAMKILIGRDFEQKWFAWTHNL